MKRVLVLTYYFPPANAVAGFRSASWARYFHEKGIRPVIVTRHWTGKEKSWSDLLASDRSAPVFTSYDHYDLIQLPTRELWLIKTFRSSLLRISILRKLTYFLLALSGHFNLFSDAYSSFLGFLRLHLKDNRYDLILATSPPLNIVRLASVLGKEYSIPFVIDFRDLWNNDNLKKGYRPNWGNAIMERLMVYWLRRWVKNASFISTVSQPIADFLGIVFEHEREVVLNGFDEVVFSHLTRNVPQAFTLTLAGTYYEQQGLDVLCQGLSGFLSGKDARRVRVRLIGVSANPIVHDKLKDAIPGEYCEWIDRTESETAIQGILDSHVLLHSAWVGYSGVYTTKLFDFIATGNTVMLAPGDNDVMDELIRETDSGVPVLSPFEMAGVLDLLYMKWESEGDIQPRTNHQVDKYSRRSQALRMADLILEYLSASQPVVSGPKRVLVVAYYFPPCLGVPAYRPLSWATQFERFGLETTVITRHWTGAEVKWAEYTRPNTSDPVYRRLEGYRVFYLPTFQYRWVRWLEKYGLFRIVFSRLFSLFSLMKGDVNPEIDAFNTFRHSLVSQLRRRKYDFVLITSPPPSIARLASLVPIYSNARVVVDFRDLWSNLLLKVDYRPDFRGRVFDFFNRLYHRKWLRSADLITVVSPPFKEVLQRLTNAKIEVVYNGYEESEFARLKKRSEPFFRFSIVGTLYPEQDLGVMLEGMKIFLSKVPPGDVLVRYIGAGQFPDVERKLSDCIPSDILEIHPKISKSEAIQYTLDSEVLFYSGWKGSRGIISTKIFDYMASGNRVIVAPGDGDVMDDFLTRSGSGVSVSTPLEFAGCLFDWYNEWKLNGRLLACVNTGFTRQFSREKQAEVMAGLLFSLAVKPQQMP
ncbi:MAG: hypothetical protein RLZZ630_1134 [Bacteroidota bacterium]|jgi:hypothetical protein